MNFRELIETMADYLETKEVEKDKGIVGKLNVDEQLLIVNYLIMIVLSKRDREMNEKQLKQNREEAKKILEKKESEKKE